MTPLDLSLRHLEIVVAVKREGTIGSASASINMSQPALTQALAKLEVQIGQRLFDRENRGSRPTQAGELFAVRAQRALAHLCEGCLMLRKDVRLPIIPHVERTIVMSQLRALLAVFRAGGYAQAGRDTGYAQPSIHRSIKDLEGIVGIPLFTRNGRNIRPADPTMHLISALSLMQSELQAGLDDLSHLVSAGAGKVVIGALPLPRGRLLPEALTLFAQDHVTADISVVEGSYVDLISGLRNGDIDFVLSDIREGALANDLTETELYADDFFIVSRAEHPLRENPILSPEQLASFPWVVGNVGTPLRGIFEKLLEGRRPASLIDCGSVMVVRRLLLEGNWLAIMSPDQYDIEQRAGLLTSIGGPLLDVRRRIGVTMRADWFPTTTQSHFFEALQTIGKRRSIQK